MVWGKVFSYTLDGITRVRDGVRVRISAIFVHISV